MLIQYLKEFLIWSYLLLFLYFGAGSYLGANLNCNVLANESPGWLDSSHVIYKGVDFKNAGELKEFLFGVSAVKYFPWVFYLPLDASVIVLAFCSGAFGGIIKIFKNLAIDKHSMLEIPVAYLPIFAGFLGLIVYLVSYILPTALTVTKNTPRPIAIMSFSIFAGLFCENTVKWLERQFEKIFQK